MGLDMRIENDAGGLVIGWQKASKIHAWIVMNCAEPEREPCDPIGLTLEDVRRLVNYCTDELCGATEAYEQYDLVRTITLLTNVVDWCEENGYGNEKPMFRYVYW